MDLTSRAVALLGTLGWSGKLLVYRNPYLWTEIKVLKLAGSWLRLSAASWCLGAHISQRWVTSDAQIIVYSYWLRHGGGAVHHWQIRKFDQIKEIIKAQLGIRSESLVGHRSAPSGMVGWCLWQLWPCPWCTKSLCRHSTSHCNVIWTSLITAPSGSQPSHQPAKTSQRSSSAHSKLLQHLCVTDVISGLTLSKYIHTAACSWSSINLRQHQCPLFGQCDVSADGALSVCRARSLLSADLSVNSLRSGWKELVTLRWDKGTGIKPHEFVL